MPPLTERLEPFSALVFDPGHAGPLDRLIAPPYDLIDRALQDDLYRRSDHNVVRLELNREPDPYAAAAATLARWRADGILKPLGRPAIYHYTQRFRHAGRELVRVGLVARVRLDEFAEGTSLPHEHPFPKAKEDRLRLLAATRLNVSSIFGLCPPHPPALAGLLEEVAARSPILRAVEDSGVIDEVRVIDDPAEVRIAQQALATARILIADGHHRYETALEYRRRRRAADPLNEGPPYDYVMMTLVAFDDPGLVILPTHRVVRHLADDRLAAFEQRLVESFVAEDIDDPSRLLAALEGHGRGAFGVALRGRSRLKFVKLKARDSVGLETLLADVAPELRALDVTVLHTLIFDRILGLTAAEIRRGGNVEYTIDARYALAEVASGRADAAFLMNPPTFAEVERVSVAGSTMPEKSTYFFPKLVTGMLLNPLD